MPRKQHIVRLPRRDRRTLTRLVRTGRQSAWTLPRARILLLADAATEGPAGTDAAVAEAAVGVVPRTVARARAAWCAQGLACLTRQPQDRPSVPPTRSTAQTLENRRPGLHRSTARICPLVVAPAHRPRRGGGDRRDHLPGDGAPGAPKRGVQPWRTARVLIPPDRDASYVAALEIVRDTYAAPADPAVPLVCFDEAGKELQAHARDPPPPRPGDPTREDPEYVRHGSANLFLSYAPHLGWRQVTVATSRTAVDWALAMRDLVDIHFPEATRIVVVLDNLNIHRVSSLYTTFPPAEAHRIARKLELRFTPRHGSWLNMAELEWAVLGRQCLNRRIADQPTLATEVAAWVAARNAVAAPASWTFTTADARTRLTHLYPFPICDTTI